MKTNRYIEHQTEKNKNKNKNKNNKHLETP